MEIKDGEEWISNGTVINPNQSVLIKCSEPSLFGDFKNMRTIFDENVRVSFEIPASRIRFTKSNDSLEIMENKILTHVKQELEIKLNTKIKLVPHIQRSITPAIKLRF